MHHHTHARHAFTLIELLVVISIISLLIAILLPAMGAAREASNMTKCLANVRQIAIAAQMYAIDNHDLHIGYTPGSDRKQLLYPYTNSGTSNAQTDTNQIWDCPSIENIGREAGHGFNTNLNWIRTAMILTPTETVSLCDAGINDLGDPITATHAFPPSRQTDGSTGFAASIGRPNPRHIGDKVNVAFADGHGAAEQMDEPFYPDVPTVWLGNGITNPDDPQYKDQLWDLN